MPLRNNSSEQHQDYYNTAKLVCQALLKNRGRILAKEKMKKESENRVKCGKKGS